MSITIYDLDTKVCDQITEDLGKDWCTDLSTRFIDEGIIDVVINDYVIFKTYGEDKSIIYLELGAHITSVERNAYSHIEIT